MERKWEAPMGMVGWWRERNSVKDNANAKALGGRAEATGNQLGQGEG